MGVTRSLVLSMLVLGSAALLVAPRVPAAQDDTAAIMKQHAAEDAAERAARWQSLQQAVFGGRAVQEGAGVIQIETPEHALDAALVPVTLTLKPGTAVKGVYLVIDNNPAPVAGHFTFGPRADPAVIKLRVRVNMYTYIHAVAEGVDGKLYVSQQFVKTSGGCSAPVGPDNTEALKDVGLMKLHLLGTFKPGKPLQAQLMIRHPNFNGMQMDQATRTFTPARFIRTIDASYDGAQVFHLDSDISLSTDPVITFGFVPDRQGTMKLLVRDSDNALFNHSFDVPAGSG
jgi:sulfur-oxidizing protein SoxY